MSLFLADMLGTTWFIFMSCGVSFVAGIQSQSNDIW